MRTFLEFLAENKLPTQKDILQNPNWRASSPAEHAYASKVHKQWAEHHRTMAEKRKKAGVEVLHQEHLKAQAHHQKLADYHAANESVVEVPRPKRGAHWGWGSGDVLWHDAEANAPINEYDERPQKQKDLDLERDEKWKPHDHPSMEHHHENHANLSGAHKSAISHYKATSSEINNHLRGKTQHGGTDDLHHHLDHVTNHEFKHDHVLYRGGHPDNPTQFRPGREFTDHGYGSTSFKPGVAADYAREHGYNERKVIHVIHAPAGTKGHYIDAHKAGQPKPHENHDEHEVLLQRGTRYKVTHHTMDSNAHYVHMKVVSQQPKSLHESEEDVILEKFAGPHREKSPAHASFTKAGFKHLSTKDHSSGRKIHKYWSGADHLDHGTISGHMHDAGYEKHGTGHPNVTVFKHKTREHDEVRVISSPGNHDILHTRA